MRPGVEVWPQSDEDDVVQAEKRARALRYHADVLAHRPIEFIAAGVRLTEPLFKETTR